jgi:hypothetical protein
LSVELEPSGAGASGGTERGRTLGETVGVARHLAHTNHAETVPTTSELITVPEGSSDIVTTPPSTLPLERGSIGLERGIGSYRFDALKSQAAEPEQTENERIADNVNHAIMDPIRAHEARNGTLADGPIVNELENTTRHLAGSPFEGHAIVAFRVDELGLVVSATIEDVSGDRRDWEEVAKATFNALAQKRIHLPAGARGLAMRVEIMSSVVLPSGARHALSVGSPAVEALDHALKGEGSSSATTPSIAGATFDISDIGAHPVRVVGARVLSESAF